MSETLYLAFALTVQHNVSIIDIVLASTMPAVAVPLTVFVYCDGCFQPEVA
jgi:hypothetical protein